MEPADAIGARWHRYCIAWYAATIAVTSIPLEARTPRDRADLRQRARSCAKVTIRPSSVRNNVDALFFVRGSLVFGGVVDTVGGEKT